MKASLIYSIVSCSAALHLQDGSMALRHYSWHALAVRPSVFSHCLFVAVREAPPSQVLKFQSRLLSGGKAKENQWCGKNCGSAK